MDLSEPANRFTVGTRTFGGIEAGHNLVKELLVRKMQLIQLDKNRFFSYHDYVQSWEIHEQPTGIVPHGLLGNEKGRNFGRLALFLFFMQQEQNNSGDIKRQ